MGENFVLAAFSTLFTVNIAMSNVSLAMVSIPFHQIMRSTTPVFTILIFRVWFGRKYSKMTYLSLIPVVAGVGLATYGDYYFSSLGFTLTLIGVLLASVKVCRFTPPHTPVTIFANATNCRLSLQTA